MRCTHNEETDSLFTWERKVEMIVHNLMQLNPAVDPATGELHPKLRGRLPHMLESFTQVRGGGGPRGSRVCGVSPEERVETGRRGRLPWRRDVLWNGGFVN